MNDRSIFSQAETSMSLPITLNQVSERWLMARLMDIEARMEKDVIVITGPITEPLDLVVRIALEQLTKRCKSSLVILDTPGGYVETAERISNILRHFYKTVDFLIPSEAMSAGTVLALSGDAIWMDYFSRLGPIDPQVERDGRRIPGLSYLRQYERLIEASRIGKLTEAELALLDKLDLAELHQMYLAAQLSVSLIRKWLSRYRFKDWRRNGKSVSIEEKEAQAEKIANDLNNHEKWGTHARGIQMDVLEQDLGLRINDFGKDAELKNLVWTYFGVTRELVWSNQLEHFVQTRSFI